MKTVDAESFQRRKDIKEGGNKKNDIFDMEMIWKVFAEKALNVEKKTLDGKNIEIYIWGNIRWLFRWIKFKIPKRVPYEIQSRI